MNKNDLYIQIGVFIGWYGNMLFRYLYRKLTGKRLLGLYPEDRS